MRSEGTPFSTFSVTWHGCRDANGARRRCGSRCDGPPLRPAPGSRAAPSRPNREFQLLVVGIASPSRRCSHRIVSDPVTRSTRSILIFAMFGVTPRCAMMVGECSSHLAPCTRTPDRPVNRPRRRAPSGACAAPTGGSGFHRRSSNPSRSRSGAIARRRARGVEPSRAQPSRRDTASRRRPAARSVAAAWPSATSWALGASSGSQTSYQFCAACSLFGTPRGGRLTVPMRRPSPRMRPVPSRTMRTVISRAEIPLYEVVNRLASTWT